MARESGKGRASGPQGSIARASGKDGPQLVRSRGRRWTDQAEALFLDHLAATCNVTASADTAGFSTVAIYKRRSRDAAFAEKWEVALRQGYAHLEMQAVRRATDALEGFAPDPAKPVPPVAFAEILNLLRLHRAGAAEQRARAGGRRLRIRSLAEVQASILTKLEAIAAMTEEEAAAAAAALRKDAA